MSQRKKEKKKQKNKKKTYATFLPKEKSELLYFFQGNLKDLQKVLVSVHNYRE